MRSKWLWLLSAVVLAWVLARSGVTVSLPQRTDALDSAIVGALFGAAAGGLVTWLLELRGRTRQRRAIASALLIELWSAEDQFTVTLTKKPISTANVLLFADAHEDFVNHVDLFSPETVLVVFAMTSALRSLASIREQVRAGKVVAPKHPDYGDWVLEVNTIRALEKVHAARVALEREGGKLPLIPPGQSATYPLVPAIPPRAFPPITSASAPADTVD
jgi:hypothetical protein